MSHIPMPIAAQAAKTSVSNNRPKSLPRFLPDFRLRAIMKSCFSPNSALWVWAYLSNLYCIFQVSLLAHDDQFLHLMCQIQSCAVYSENVEAPIASTRYLGLDIGSKRIGVAITDELGLTVQPVLTLNRRSQTREDIRSIARLCRRYNVSAIVVGDPLHLSGKVSSQAERVHEFAAELGELAKLPIHFIDERLTSHVAHEMLYEAGHKRQQHKALVDQVAAVLILETFLESLKHDHAKQESKH